MPHNRPNAYSLQLTDSPGTLRPAQNKFPQGCRISVILKINTLHPFQATRSGVFRGFLFGSPFHKSVNSHIINALIVRHPFHPFSSNPRVSHDTLGGAGYSSRSKSIFLTSPHRIFQASELLFIVTSAGVIIVSVC